MSHSPLAPCPACQRHVRSDSSRCPFCAAAIAIAPASVVPAATTTLSRAAAFTFATSLALGCASTQDPAPQGNPVATTEPAPVTPTAGPQDPGAPMAIYGAPAPMTDPADAGATPPADAGEPTPADVPATPPAVDAGRPVRPTRPSGSIGVRYGSPPRPED